MIIETKYSLEAMIEEERKKKKRRSAILLIIVTGVICYVLLKLVFGISVIEGDSMSPEILNGNIVIINRLEKEYSAGDIVIAMVNDTEIIKRVKFIENGEVFLLGDNQSVSVDSYDFGMIPEEDIVGRVICVIKIL